MFLGHLLNQITHVMPPTRKPWHYSRILFSCCIAYKDCGSSDDGDNDSKNAQKDGYSSSTTNESDDSDEGETDFFGLNSNEKEIKVLDS